MAQPTLQDVLELVQQLSPADRSRLVHAVAQLPPAELSRSQYGVLAHLGPAPSMDDFDVARRS